MKVFYLLLALLGAVLPLTVLAPWAAANGLVPVLFVQAALANTIGLFAWVDVLISAVVLLAFVVVEGRRLGMTYLWLPCLGTCLVGVSFGLPLFLFMREQRLQCLEGTGC